MKKDRWEPVIRHLREFLEDQWFDRTRGVRTSGNLLVQKAGLSATQIADGEIY